MKNSKFARAATCGAAIVGCVVAANVAYSQPPSPTPTVDSAYNSNSEATPTPTPATAPLSAEAATPYTGMVNINTPIRRMDIAESSLPFGTADALHRRVNVTFSQPVPTNATVEFAVVNSDGNNGSARVVQDANRRTNGTISLEGTAQTEPGFAGNLKVECRINGDVVGQSNGFSVCSHQNGLHYRYDRNLQGVQTPVTGPGVLVWGVEYGLPIGSVDSDSGNSNDLTQISIGENVKVDRAGTDGAFGGKQDTAGTFYPVFTAPKDYVGVPASSASDVQRAIDAAGTSHFVGEQYHTFTCARCNITGADAALVPYSGFRQYVTVSKSTTAAARYYARVRKSGYDNNGTSAGTVDSNLTQTIEVK